MSVPLSTDKCPLSEVARHIAQAAARLFATRGYDATPVRAIVEAAGVTKPTLYYHFKSKEGLAQALLTMPLSDLVGRLRSVLAEGGDPVEVLTRTLQVHFDFSREDPDRSRFFFALWFGPLGSGLATELAKFSEELDGLMTDAIRLLATSGRIAPERLDDCASAFRGFLVIAIMDFLYRGADLGPDLAGRLVSNLLHGFGRGDGANADRGVTR